MHRDAFLNSWVQTKACQEGTIAEIIGSEEDLKVVEHLGGRTV
jgi:hypothetical protein